VAHEKQGAMTMASVGIKRIDELSEKITQLTMKTTAEEPLRLFVEMSSIAKRGENYRKASVVVSFIVLFGVFFTMDRRSDTWFHYDALFIALILGFAAMALSRFGITRIGESILAPEIDDWARRADLLVRGNTDAASTSAPNETIAAPLESKPQPIPISQFQKIMAIGAGLLGLIFLGFGLYKQKWEFVFIGAASMLFALTQLFHRPDR
jgi:hypothetical protein